MAWIEPRPKPGSKGKRYLVCWRDPSTGRKRSKLHDGYNDARDFKNRIELEVEAERDRANGTFAVGDLCDHWLAEGEAQQLEPATRRQYGDHVRLHIKPAPGPLAGVTLGDTPAAKLTPTAVRGFRTHLLDSLSRAQAKKILTSFKSICKLAVQNGHLNVNPADNITIKIEQRHKSPVVIPSKDEIGKFYRTLRDMPVCFRKAFFWTELLTGARPSELRGLRWEDVRLTGKNPGLQIAQRADEYGNLGALKTKAAARFLPLTGEAAAVLKEWRLQCPKGPDGQLDLVFPNSVGKPWLWPNLTRRQYRPLMYAAGLARCLGRDNKGAMILEAKYHPYAWRHAFASLQIEQGCNPKWLSKRMGHESVSFTLDTYGHLFEDATADQAAAASHMNMLDQLAN